MDNGTVVEWLVKPGDKVKRGDVVAVVDTKKAAIEVEIFADGVIDQILVPVGEKVPVGTVLATVLAEGGTLGASGNGHKPHVQAPAAVGEPRRVMRPVAPPPSGERHRVSPLARRVADKLGVDLDAVTGTGPQGAVTQADVERAAAARAPQETVPVADRQLAMREAIAALMARSKREIPHYYLGQHLDVSRAAAWLAEENLKRSIAERLLFSVLLLKAVALAVHEVPDMNGFWIDGQFQAGGGVHLGVAISLRQGGLIAPAIHDADKQSLDQLMASLRELVKRTRAGVLRSSEMSDPTLTVTNLGDQGVETVYGVIYPPQVALVGFGRQFERPWAENGMVGSRPVVHATLAGDHRASDGHRGGLFLAAIERLLQEPEKL